MKEDIGDQISERYNTVKPQYVLVDTKVEY